jgi:E3 ubiquitin-protein ligase RAD18
VIQTAAAIKDKDFDGAAWAAKHDSSFRDLIASARKNGDKAKKKLEKEEDKSTTDQPQSSTTQPPDLMVISSSEPPASRNPRRARTYANCAIASLSEC